MYVLYFVFYDLWKRATTSRALKSKINLTQRTLSQVIARASIAKTSVSKSVLVASNGFFKSVVKYDVKKLGDLHAYWKPKKHALETDRIVVRGCMLDAFGFF